MPRPAGDLTGRKVYVGNLEPDVTADQLEDIFRKFGTIAATWIARNPPGFAFVTFEDSRDAKDAVAELDGMKFQGRTIRVEISHMGGGKGGRGRFGRRFGNSPRDGGYSRGGYDDDFERKDRDERHSGYGRSRRGRSRSRDVSPRYGRIRGNSREMSQEGDRDRGLRRGERSHSRSPRDRDNDRSSISAQRCSSQSR